MYGIIYLITNIANGKTYVGQTIQGLNNRLDQHRWDSNKRGCLNYPIYRAFKKYGIQNFIMVELYEASSKEELDTAEIKYSDIYGSMVPRGYNLRVGNSAGKTSQQTRDKISKSLRGIPRKKGVIPSIETRLKMSAAHKGNTYCLGVRASKEAKVNMSKAQKGKKMSDEAKANMSKAQKGRTFTLETKNKMSEAKKGKPLSDKHIQALTASAHTGADHHMFGKKHSSGSLEKMSKAKLGCSGTNNRKTFCITNGTEYPSATKAAKELNLSRSCVTSVCLGKRAHTKGFNFKYV